MANVSPLRPLYCSFLRVCCIKNIHFKYPANDRHAQITISAFPFKTNVCQSFRKSFANIWLETRADTVGGRGTLARRKWEYFKIPRQADSVEVARKTYPKLKGERFSCLVSFGLGKVCDLFFSTSAQAGFSCNLQEVRAYFKAQLWLTAQGFWCCGCESVQGCCRAAGQK